MIVGIKNADFCKRVFSQNFGDLPVIEQKSAKIVGMAAVMDNFGHYFCTEINLLSSSSFD